MEMMRVDFMSGKAFFQRLILISILLVFGGEGILSEENNSHKPIGFQSIYQTQRLKVHIQQKDFFIFQPVVYQKSISTIHLKPAKLLTKNLLIMGKGHLGKIALADFLKENNPKVTLTEAEKIAGIYIEEATAEGVNYDIAFSQMCLETGFLRYDGQVHPNQNNFCGLGVAGRGTQGLNFPSERIGIRAHIQHLKAYASTVDLHHKLVDSRFRFVHRGSIKNIDGLTGKWASDKHYGHKIHSLLSRMYSIR